MKDICICFTTLRSQAIIILSGLITRYNVYWRDLIDAMVISLVKEVAGTLLWNTDHRGPGHLRAPVNGVGHSSSEAMDEEPSGLGLGLGFVSMYNYRGQAPITLLP